MCSLRLFLPSSVLLLGATLLASPAFAQQTATPPAPMPAAATDLAIPAPPGGILRVEMDARSDDLLGMVKSFLKGVGETGTTEADKSGKAPANPIAEALDAGNLADTLKDVNHIHFIVWELPGAPSPPPTFSAPTLPFSFPGKPHAKKAKAAPVPSHFLAETTRVAPVSTFDSNAFYESAFSSEGAHRILYADADAYKLVMVGFPDRKGYAFAVSGAGYVAVSRSDGYPNPEALSAFISRITSAVMKSKAGKDMMDATMSGDKGSGVGDEKK